MNSSTTLLMEFTPVPKSNANYTRQIFVAAVKQGRGGGGRGGSDTKLNGLMRNDGRGRENGSECGSPTPRKALNPLAAGGTVKRFKELRKH